MFSRADNRKPESCQSKRESRILVFKNLRIDEPGLYLVVAANREMLVDGEVTPVIEIRFMGKPDDLNTSKKRLQELVDELSRLVDRFED